MRKLICNSERWNSTLIFVFLIEVELILKESIFIYEMIREFKKIITRSEFSLLRGN